MAVTVAEILLTLCVGYTWASDINNISVIIDVSNSYLTAGLISLTYRGKYAHICHYGDQKNWGRREGDTACKQLQFAGGWPYDIDQGKYGSHVQNLNNFDCDETDTDLNYCEYDFTDECENSKLAGIQCYSSFEVKLVGGISSNVGRVEVRYNDKWSSVCYESTDGSSNDWSFANAQVVCRELGFPGTMFARQGGQGQGKLGHSINGYQCREDLREESLRHCYPDSPKPVLRESNSSCSFYNSGGNNEAVAICAVPGYVGCYNYEEIDSIDKDKLTSRSMTINECRHHCRYLIYRYAILQNGDTCFCNSLVPDSRHGDTFCAIECSGDGQQVCGDITSVSVYDEKVDDGYSAKIIGLAVGVSILLLIIIVIAGFILHQKCCKKGAVDQDTKNQNQYGTPPAGEQNRGDNSNVEESTVENEEQNTGGSGKDPDILTSNPIGRFFLKRFRIGMKAFDNPLPAGHYTRVFGTEASVDEVPEGAEGVMLGNSGTGDPKTTGRMPTKDNEKKKDETTEDPLRGETSSENNGEKVGEISSLLIDNESPMDNKSRKKPEKSSSKSKNHDNTSKRSKGQSIEKSGFPSEDTAVAGGDNRTGMSTSTDNVKKPGELKSEKGNDTDEMNAKVIDNNNSVKTKSSQERIRLKSKSSNQTNQGKKDHEKQKIENERVPPDIIDRERDKTEGSTTATGDGSMEVAPAPVPQSLALSGPPGPAIPMATLIYQDALEKEQKSAPESCLVWTPWPCHTYGHFDISRRP
ncbi:uncharacterized protein [Amphiura filiformis]|uniref:uncharacterized protein isoform X2 n=1 Tax=Amphiura filiformis TaxID=82378 RepID=UPI003B20C8B4